MKMQKKALLIGLFLLMGLPILDSSPVQAGATAAEFTSIETITDPGQGKVWFESNMMYIRDAIFTASVEGDDLYGFLTGEGNFNIDMNTGNGVGWGTNIFDGYYRDMKVGFEGSSTCKIIQFFGPSTSILGKFVSHGSQGFDGMLIKGTFVTVGADLILSGVILDPHGTI
ncbi:MAG: hypothetical protein ACFFDT_31660 [Candidatus Hodarchaeota archaeon]